MGPSTRPSIGMLARTLSGLDGIEVEERWLQLVPSRPDQPPCEAPDANGLHHLLIVRQGSARLGLAPAGCAQLA